MPNGQPSPQPDYYSLLGVSRNADKKELKKAFREKALENHPDRLSHMPEEEREKRKDMMYEINEAYGVLSNPEQRQVYDRQSKERVRTRSPEGRTSTRRTKRSGVSYDDLFNSFFREGGIFGNEGNFGSWGGLWESPGRKQEDHFMMPETDWGLLVALKKAYEAKEDGKWRVKKAEDDKRDWMPEEVYSVKREGDNVYVFRVITDWRNEWDRDKKIEVRKEGAYWEKEKEMKPDTFLGEYYLYGKGKNRLTDSYKIPHQFGEHLRAMKSLAKKFARKETDDESKYDVDRELRIINRYGEYGSNNTRVEGKSLWSDDEDREWVRKVTFDDFWKRMRQAEGAVVQVEGLPKSKEGQVKTPTEGEGISFSGETKG